MCLTLTEKQASAGRLQDLLQSKVQNLPDLNLGTQTLPVPNFGDLGLKDGRTIIVDGKAVELPLGFERALTAEAVMQFLALCERFMLLLETHKGSWRRVDKDEVIDLTDGQRFKREEKPRPAPEPAPSFRTVPSSLTRD